MADKAVTNLMVLAFKRYSKFLIGEAKEDTNRPKSTSREGILANWITSSPVNNFPSTTPPKILHLSLVLENCQRILAAAKISPWANSKRTESVNLSLS